jgi:2-enoate reductase
LIRGCEGMDTFEKLFEPIRICGLEIKNRLAFAPIAKTGLVTPDGIPMQRALDYYAERIKGNVGLVIMGVARVEAELEKRQGGRMLVSPDIVSPLAELTEFAHHHGARVFVQLTAGEGRNNPRILTDPTTKLISASRVPSYWNPSYETRALETEEIARIVAAFGNATLILKRAGIDGVELNGHEGYLLDQFATLVWNERNDKYGGALKARLAFAQEILETIKSTAGKDFPVIYRYGLKHYLKQLRIPALKQESFKEIGRDIHEGIEMARLLENMGFDALDVDAGCYDSWYWAHPPLYQEHGCLVDLAAKVKEIVRIPVITAGRLEIPGLAEKIVREGKADIIALGRGLLADPYWLKKLQEGRPEDIRPCIGCHEGCLQRIVAGKPLSCAVNPACGREQLFEVRPVAHPKKVLIIGGGVAGMEAARVASLRHHSVVLWERENSLGGHLREASVPMFKEDVGRLLEWYQTQLKKLDLEINCNVEVTREKVVAAKPDVVMVATGSVPNLPEIDALNRSTVATVKEYLLGNLEIGEQVVVIGGGLVGLETALWLVQKGKKVTVVEILPEVAQDVALSNRQMLLDLLRYHRVEIKTDTTVSCIMDHDIQVVHNGRVDTIACDNVVLATGFKPVDDLYNNLRGVSAEIFKIGDCCVPGKIMDAIWSAYDIARLI